MPQSYSLLLEIMEETLLKDSQLLETIFEELKKLGVRLAIDDFGKEYSSLTYLKRLPVDVLKIDGSFVESLGEDPTNTTIVEVVIKLAHSLGVESAEQLAYLRRMACDFAQGFILATPLPSEEVELLLKNRPLYCKILQLSVTARRHRSMSNTECVEGGILHQVCLGWSKRYVEA